MKTTMAGKAGRRKKDGKILLVPDEQEAGVGEQIGRPIPLFAPVWLRLLEVPQSAKTVPSSQTTGGYFVFREQHLLNSDTVF